MYLITFCTDVWIRLFLSHTFTQCPTHPCNEQNNSRRWGTATVVDSIASFERSRHDGHFSALCQFDFHHGHPTPDASNHHSLVAQPRNRRPPWIDPIDCLLSRTLPLVLCQFHSSISAGAGKGDGPRSTADTASQGLALRLSSSVGLQRWTALSECGVWCK